jgi:hypothetical protein
MGRLESPREYPEQQGDGVCESCHLKYDDLTFVLYCDVWVATCPECGDDIEVDPPEPDFDRDDYDRRHRL